MNAPPPAVRRHNLRRVFTLMVLTGTCLGQTVETPRFRVSLREDGALEVMDKTADVTWTQPAAMVKVSAAVATADELSFTVNDNIAIRVSVRADSVNFTLNGNDSHIEGVEYPGGFSLAEPTRPQTLLLPYCAGMAIPFAAKDRPDLKRAADYYDACNNQMGLMMPWIATTDGQAGSLMLIETPFDARFKVWTDAVGYQYSAAWKDTKGCLGYERRVRYYFRGEGGAVALCKAYREHARAEGLLVTLKEKQKTIPAIDRFIGAMSLWVVEWPDLDLFKTMKTAGIDRALVSFHTSEKIPPGTVNRYGHNTTYEPMTRDFTAQLHELGYLAGRYDYYRTIYPPNDSGRGGNGWIMRFTGYPEQLSHDEKGNIRAGFQGGNRAPNTPLRGQRCPKCQYEMAQIYIPLDVDRTGYDARLLDAVCAVSWQECYNPAHPTTRIEDMEWRRKQLQVAVENDQITGTEHIAHWAVPHAVYAEAPTTFVRFAGYRESFNAKPFETPGGYSSVVLDERLRFPLWQLVFHDAIIVTNRWTFAANRYADEKVWDKEDLMNLLHGHMPTFMLNRENYTATAAHLVKTFQTVCEWNRAIGYEEMTDFRWLTPDGSVQQAVYASGRSTVVNFGENDFALSATEKVPAKGFLQPAGESRP